MSDWNLENCKKNYSELIPSKLTEGYKLTKVLLTTFSLQQIQLHEFLYEIDALELIPKGGVHVFYDLSDRDGKEDVTSVISEKFLHGIKLKDNGKLYAFHPKISLLRYEKIGASDSIRYVIIVSSKNISTADLLLSGTLNESSIFTLNEAA